MKTAVEFIFDAVYRDIPFSELLGIITQAKIMEKQQMIEMHDKGFDFAMKEIVEPQKNKI
jgi:hypothetical protein